MVDFTELQNRLGHSFADVSLLEMALTHRSFANERRDQAFEDNERLEFLGDSVLSLVASSMLYRAFFEASEGELTRRRADLVCEGTLAAIAHELGLADALRLGRGEERSGGRKKPRLLASALEACLGAVYLDAGIEAAIQVTFGLLEPRVTNTDPGAGDYKSRLQEMVQARGVTAPRYEVVGTEGPDHERRFYVAMKVGDATVGQGEGRSKVDAEQAAARAAFEKGIDTWLPPNVAPERMLDRLEDFGPVDPAVAALYSGMSRPSRRPKPSRRPRASVSPEAMARLPGPPLLPTLLPPKLDPDESDPTQ